MDSGNDVLSITTITLILLIEQVYSLGCFTCSTFNNSNPSCTDPFYPDYNVRDNMYEPYCKQGIKNRVGKFPASFCVKMDGVSMTTGAQITVRTCTLDNMDYQCGIFNFEDEIFRGCLVTCENDACNRSVSLHTSHSCIVLVVLLSLLVICDSSKLIGNECSQCQIT